MSLPETADNNGFPSPQGTESAWFSHPAGCCSFFTHAPCAVLLVDRPGNVLASNEKARALFPFLSIENDRHMISRIIGREEWEEHYVMRTLDETGSVTFEEISHRDNGTSFAIEVAVSLMPGQNDIACVFIRDITRQKKLREEIVESEKKYRLLVENLSVGVVLVKEGFSVFANRGFMNILGLNEIDIVAQPFERLFDGPSSLLVSNALESASLGKRVVGPIEANVRKKNGDTINLDMSLSLAQYDGAPAIQVIVQDVTEKKKIDEQLRLSARMASLGRIATGMAHEINNPLASLSIDIQRLLAGSRSKQRKEQFARMLRTVHRITSLAEDLLHAGKKKHYNFTYHNIKGHVEHVLNTLKASFDDENKEFRLNSSGSLPQVRGDGTQMDQVFINIVKNALEAMPAGGLLDVTIRNLPIQSSVEVIFADDGPGIAPGVMQHVFEPFFTTRKAGTGLGLAISKGIIEQLDGSLTLRNRKPHGLEVSIVLPAPRPPALDLPARGRP